MYKKSATKKRPAKKSNQPVKNKDFNRKVSTAMNKLAEVHHFDLFNSGILTTTPLITLLLKPAQTITDVGRVGDFVRLTSLQMKFILLNGPTTTLPHIVRILLFQWYDETAPTASNILQNTGSPQVMVSPPSYDRVRNNNNMKILYDRTFVINRPGSGSDGHVVSKYLSGFKKKVFFNSGATDPTNGAIYSFMVTDSAVAAEQPSVNLVLRSLFVDY